MTGRIPRVVFDPAFPRLDELERRRPRTGELTEQQKTAVRTACGLGNTSAVLTLDEAQLHQRRLAGITERNELRDEKGRFAKSAERASSVAEHRVAAEYHAHAAKSYREAGNYGPAEAHASAERAHRKAISSGARLLYSLQANITSANAHAVQDKFVQNMQATQEVK